MRLCNKVQCLRTTGHGHNKIASTSRQTIAFKITLNIIIMAYLSIVFVLVIAMCCDLLQTGRTALHIAASNNHVDVVKMLLMEDSTLIKLSDNVSYICSKSSKQFTVL